MESDRMRRPEGSVPSSGRHARRKKSSFIFWIVFAFLLVAEVLLMRQLWLLGMLPKLYFAFVAAVLVLVTLILALLLFPTRGRTKKKQRTKQRIRIVAAVLAVLMAAGCLVGNSTIAQARRAIDAVTQIRVISDVIGFYVLAENPAQSIQDVANDSFAVAETGEWDVIQKALLAVAVETLVTPRTQTYATPFEAIDALYAGEVGVVVLDTSYVSILESVELYADFESRARLLYEHEIVKEPEFTPTPRPVLDLFNGKDEEEEQEVELKKGEIAPFIVYISGSDTRSSQLTTSRSDVNILGVVNPNTKQVLLVNTPRDYYIAIPRGNWSMDKLTHCGIYGVDCSIGALENLYGIDVDYYAQINFAGFEKMIDAIGGVTVYSERSFYTNDGMHYFQAGDNNLNGAAALAFARERYNLSGGDNARGNNQMRVIEAILKKAMSGTTIISNYSDILSSLGGTFATNMPQEKMAELVQMQLKDMASWDIQQYAVTGTGNSRTTYSIPGMKVYVTIPDDSSVSYASELIQQVLTAGVSD